jgi:integral membrane protein (TIGR01906 family)
MREVLPRLCQSLIVLLMPLVLILSSIQFLSTDAYLAYEYAKPDFPVDSYGFRPDERFTHARDNLEYVRAGQPLEALSAQTHRNSPLYNIREISHMQDVQAVFRAARLGWLASLALAILAGAILVFDPYTRYRLARALVLGGGMTALLVFTVGFLAVIAWQAWFQLFHQAFFAAGTWTFAASDTLIRLFPEKFWFDAALTVTGISLAAGGLLYLIGVRFPFTAETKPV